MKTIFLFVFCCLTTMSFAQQCVLADHTLMHQSANKTSSTVATLAKGTEVLDLYKEGEWLFVRTLREDVKEQGFMLQTALSPCKTIEKEKKEDKEELPDAQHDATTEVLICNSKTATSYHHHKCHGLAKCDTGITEKISVKEAKTRGLKPCGICYKK